MSVILNHQTLSALNPVSVDYQYDNAQKLKGNYALYSHGIQTYNYQIFKNFEDAGFSKKNAVILTSIKDLKEVFETPIENIKVGTLAGNCFLDAANNLTLNGDVRIRLYNNNLYVGGKGEEVVFNILPLKQNTAKIRVNNFYLQVSKHYPYDIVLSKTTLPSFEQDREIFYIDFIENNITFKSKTSSGFKYLSYGTDRKLRCVGLELNYTRLSQYSFIPTFVTSPTIDWGFDPTVHEIKYFNDVESGAKQKTVELLSAIQMDTSLLITLPTSKLADQNTKANIALLKTNFTNTGSYNPTL